MFQISSTEALDVLATQGYSQIILQIGSGDFQPSERDSTQSSISLSSYRLKSSIADDIASADLVISHAGAGSVMDSLMAGKRLLVVINDELMGNHQTELAEKLAKEKHLDFCNVDGLVDALRTFDKFKVEPYNPGNPSQFRDYLIEKIQCTPEKQSTYSLPFFIALVYVIIYLLYHLVYAV